ncbi:hypothetical protein PR048_027539 [Dryococelus australis]|uniref:Uncharacterized protein n=1 Tax=Dryococelus australis TaxID=614101 RepID=A0ABQ9GGT2_9NEOP|nr:hypothetical protein PR048_027539 [Dryococelus australis]
MFLTGSPGHDLDRQREQHFILEEPSLTSRGHASQHSKRLSLLFFTLRIMRVSQTALVSLLPPLLRGRGGTAAIPLSSRGGETDSIPEFSHVGIMPGGDAARRVFSGISRFPRPSIPALLHTHLASPSPALKTPVLSVAKISPLHPLHPTSQRTTNLSHNTQEYRTIAPACAASSNRTHQKIGVTTGLQNVGTPFANQRLFINYSVCLQTVPAARVLVVAAALRFHDLARLGGVLVRSYKNHSKGLPITRRMIFSDTLRSNRGGTVALQNRGPVCQHWYASLGFRKLDMDLIGLACNEEHYVPALSKTTRDLYGFSDFYTARPTMKHDAHVRVALSASIFLDLGREKSLQPGGHLKESIMVAERKGPRPLAMFTQFPTGQNPGSHSPAIESGSPNAGTKGRKKQEIPEKTRRPTASSVAIPTCENQGAIRWESVTVDG